MPASFQWMRGRPRPRLGSRFDGIDILVNNAGIHLDHP
jgi:NAD(P)-dependent dehydrogenase (short-subunit alcohol dehydrogenase family)